LTYWLRKCVACCAPRLERCHQVWSWYDHPLPSYGNIAADTLRDIVILTFDLLTLVSSYTWRVTWSTPPPSLNILRLSVLQLSVLTSPIGYHWQCVCRHCACAVSHDLHIWNPWPRSAYSLFNFYGATMTFKGRFALSNSNVKAVFGRKFLSAVLIGPQNDGFWGNRDIDVKFSFCDP